MPAPPETASDWLRTGDAARLLGVSTQTVRRLIADGALRAIDTARPGCRPSYRVLKADLTAYIRAVQTAAPPEGETDERRDRDAGQAQTQAEGRPG